MCGRSGSIRPRSSARVTRCARLDVYKLAAIALSAAIRNENDLLELLPDPPKPKPAPRLVAAPVLELTA